MGQHSYACGHPAGFHVDARCLGCVNIAAFEPDCGTPTGPPTWQVTHRFRADRE